MRKQHWLFAVLFIALSPVLMQAQSTPDGGDRMERHQDQQAVQNDIREIQDMQLLLDRIEEAHSIGDLASVDAMKGDVLAIMQYDLSQDTNSRLKKRQQEIYEALSSGDFTAKGNTELMEEYISLMEKLKG
ncbi:MAG: hypothetical protein GYB31_20425 [Bacteroidetes bacterium]|nr:hypothetical protein [Bacteroidota bacterium]